MPQDVSIGIIIVCAILFIAKPIIDYIQRKRK